MARYVFDPFPPLILTSSLASTGCVGGDHNEMNITKLTPSQLQKMIATSAVKPNFDRQLRTKYGITDYLRAAFLLGGSGVKEGFTRWVLFVLIAAIAKKGIDSRGGLPNYLR